MKRISKWMARICAAALLIGIVGVVPAKAASSALKVETPDNKVLTYQYREAQDFELKITNTGSTELRNISVSPKLKTENDEWPFKTDIQRYEETLASLGAGKTDSVRFNFTQRDDAGNKRYMLTFDITAEDAAGNTVVEAEKSFYVNTSAKEEVSEQASRDSGSAAEIDTLADAGGYDNGSVSYSGGSSSGSASVPRVIVTGFTTDPGDVQAGSDFTLTIHLKNTSKTSRVSNMLFELQAPTGGSDAQTSSPAFLPTSGSNSIYLDGIAANGTADISMKLNAKADLVQKPYEINLSMKYEDSQAAQVDAQANLSIPVKQNARFEFSEFEITPKTVEVGNEANVSTNLYNLGKIKLYNVKAIFEGDHIAREEAFLGNLEAGSSTSIDVMLETTKESEGEGTVTMTLSYEDEAGAVSTAEKTFSLPVTKATESAATTSETVVQSSGNSLPVIPIGIVVILAAAIGTVVVRKKKKKAHESLDGEEDFLDELDGSSEDEQ